MSLSQTLTDVAIYHFGRNKTKGAIIRYRPLRFISAAGFACTVGHIFAGSPDRHGNVRRSDIGTGTVAALPPGSL